MSDEPCETVSPTATSRESTIARMRRGDVHRRLVAFQRDQRSLRLYAVPGGDEHLDDGDVAEVADVRDGDGQRIGHGPVP